jgi:phage-related baseplate assembly protein
LTGDYEFISTDVNKLVQDITSMYTSITGESVSDASPVKLFIQWVASAMILMAVNINQAGNQNIPSRAYGENLDALAELFYQKTRPQPTPATVQIEFTISEAQSSAVLIPAGTRVTSLGTKAVFATDEDVYVEIGETTATVSATCQTAGTVGNGFAAGTLTTCVDVFSYYASCTNTDTSAGGSDVPNDEEFYEQLVSSEDAYSCAGPTGAYKYFVKSVSSDIADVHVTSLDAGEVDIYILMKDGTVAGSEIKAKALAACSADEIRPLTDNVVIGTPDITTFDVTLTYYISRDNASSAATIQAAVTKAVDDYVKWQTAKFGRDINPSKLIQMVMDAGVKRVVLTDPEYTVLSDGNGEAPGLAQVGTVTITNGGYEYE